MRFIFLAIAFWATATAALAEPLFSDKLSYREWKIFKWNSGPLPTPQGWTFTEDKAKILGTTSNILKGLPKGGTWNAKWIDTGVLVWRFHWGAPNNTNRDTLHLTLLKALATGSKGSELLAWEELGNTRATLYRAVGKGDQSDRNLILSHWGPDNAIYVMSVFTPEAEFEHSGALFYAGALFTALTGQDNIAKQIEDLKPRPQFPAQSKPYQIASETKPVEWQGRAVHVPADWQVKFQPIEPTLPEAYSMLIEASPNLADEDAPKMSYARWSAEKGTALDLLKLLVEAAKKSEQGYTVERMSKIGEVACALGTSSGKTVEVIHGYVCTTNGEIDGAKVAEAFAFSAPEDVFEEMSGKKIPLLMTQEIEPDRLSDELSLQLDPAKKLLTTRVVPPFPALVPVGKHRVPAGWETELSFLDGEMRFKGPGEGENRPILAFRGRTDTGTDAEIALTALIEDYGIADFELMNSDYLPGVNGLVVVGTGARDGDAVKFGAIAEADDPSIYTFQAPPEQFDAMGGVSLLAPVFLKFPPDSFDGVTDPAERMAMIAKSEGERIAKEREEMRQLKIWQMKTETETIIHAYRAMSYSMACGSWC